MNKSPQVGENQNENEDLTDSEELAAAVLANLSTVLEKELKINEDSKIQSQINPETVNKSWQYIINLLNNESPTPDNKTIIIEKPIRDPFSLQPPKFPGLSSKWVDTVIDPFLVFNNNQMVFKRCETHRAIAYFIHYSQKYNTAKELHNNDKPYNLMNMNLDPTAIARKIKENNPNLVQKDVYSSIPPTKYYNQQINNNMQLNRNQSLKKIKKDEEIKINTKSMLGYMQTVNSLPSLPVNKGRIDTILSQNPMENQTNYSFF